MDFPSGTILFAGPDDGDGVAAAREYIARHGLTKETVALLSKGGSTIVRMR